MNETRDFDGDELGRALQAMTPATPPSPGILGVEVARLARKRQAARRYSAVAGGALSVALVLTGALTLGHADGKSPTADGPTSTTPTSSTPGPIRSTCPRLIAPGAHVHEHPKPPADVTMKAAAVCEYRFDKFNFDGERDFELTSAQATEDPSLVADFTDGVRRSVPNFRLPCPNIPGDAPKHRNAQVVMLFGDDGSVYYALTGPYCVLTTYPVGPAHPLFPSRTLQHAIADLSGE